MNKKALEGWDKVFSFAFRQTIKSKGFIVSTIIMVAVIMGGIAYTALSKGSSDDQSEIISVDIEKVYLYDETGMKDVKLEERLKEISKNYDETTVDVISDEGDDIETTFEEKDDCNKAALVHISLGKTSYIVDVVRTKDSVVSDMVAGLFEGDVQTVMSQILYEQAGITKDQIEFMSNEVKTNVSEVSGGSVTDEKAEKTSNFMSNSQVAMAIFMIMVFILAIGGENASTAMVTEKGTRVIEYILTSVRPLALITGKVLASIASQLLQIVLLIGGGAGMTFLMTHGATKVASASELAGSLGVDAMVENLNPIRVIIALLIIFAGIMFYIIIAALIGSTASKMEELAQTNMVYSFILIIGAYSAMVLTMADFEKGSFVQKFLLAFPFSAPFVTPSFVLAGDCSILMGIVSLIVLLIAVILMIMLVAKVFESVIMYTGSKVTFKKMLEIAGIKKAPGKNEGGVKVE